MSIGIFFFYYAGLALFYLMIYFVNAHIQNHTSVKYVYRYFFTYAAASTIFIFLLQTLVYAYTLFETRTGSFVITSNLYLFPYIYIFSFVTTISCLFCLLYRTTENIFFYYYLLLIIIAGSGLFYTTNVVLFFFMYEMLLLPSFIILYKFAKTRRCIEAAYLMFFWTQLGAAALLFVLYYIFTLTNTILFNQWELCLYTTSDIYICFWLLLLGFGVKFPIWPFYGWLPRAHVEASTNFSIFLSGVLVKFAFLGFFKFLMCFTVPIPVLFVYPFLCFGLVDAAFKLFYQIDLKKIIAYATVIEMHWLTICILSVKSIFFWSGMAMLTSHAILSTNSFLLVDAVTRRFKTRLLTELGGLCWLTPKLFLFLLINLLIFLGIPGTLFFIAEFLFFYALVELHAGFAFFLLFFLYFLVPTFFFRSFSNVLFGLCFNAFRLPAADLTLFECLLYGLHILLLLYFSWTWQFCIYV